MRDIKTKMDFSTIVLILSVSAVISYGYFREVDWSNRLELHSQIIAGTAVSPFRYRILVPFSAEFFIKALSTVVSVKAAFFLSYAAYDLLAIFFLLTMLFLWLRTWFNREQSLIGVLFTAGTMPIALQDRYFQSCSLLETGLFVAALLAIHRKRYWFLFFLVALASLNRETALFIPLAFFLTIDKKSFFNTRSKNDWKPVLLFGQLLLIWAIVFWGLRYSRGSAPHFETIAEVLAANIPKVRLFLAFVKGSLFLGGLWVFALLGFRHAPDFIKRVALIVPFYLITVMIWGRWTEVRLLMPLYPVLVPLGLSFLYSEEKTITD